MHSSQSMYIFPVFTTSPPTTQSRRSAGKRLTPICQPVTANESTLTIEGQISTYSYARQCGWYHHYC